MHVSKEEKYEKEVQYCGRHEKRNEIKYNFKKNRDIKVLSDFPFHLLKLFMKIDRYLPEH